MFEELKEKRGKLGEVNKAYKALLDESVAADGTKRLANIKSVADPVGELEKLQTSQKTLGAEVAALDILDKAE